MSGKGGLKGTGPPLPKSGLSPPSKKAPVAKQTPREGSPAATQHALCTSVVPQAPPDSASATKEHVMPSEGPLIYTTFSLELIDFRGNGGQFNVLCSACNSKWDAMAATDWEGPDKCPK